MDPLPFCATQAMGLRNDQEDTYGFVHDGPSTSSGLPTVFILADGMGGYKGGAIASQIAVDSVKAQLMGRDSLDPAELETLIRGANEDIAHFLRVTPSSKGLGTTLVIAMIKHNCAYWSSVGDSALYVASKSQGLNRLNEDHSMKPVLDRMIAAGLQSSEDYDAIKNKRNMLRSALTGSELELVDTNTHGFQLDCDDTIIICSDGLESISETDINDVIQKKNNCTLSEMCLSLVNTVEDAKNATQDNSTIILIDPAPYIELL